MAHEIEYAAIHGAAWHNAGTRVDHLMTVEEALDAGGLADWNLKKQPMWVELPVDAPTNQQGLPTMWFAGKKFIQADDVFGHVRMKDSQYLGPVGKIYQSIHNEYGADVLRLLCDKEGEEAAHIKSLGSLRGGKKVWILLSLKDANIQVRGGLGVNAELVPYLLYTNSHDGSSAAEFMLTTVNVVCMNTLNAALGEQYAKIKVTVRHTGNVQEKIADVQRMMAEAHKAFGDFEVKANELANRVASKDDLEQFFNALFPPLTGEDAQNSAKVKNRNQKVILLGEALRQEVLLLPQYTSTATAAASGMPEMSYWTLLQGLTRFTTHMQGVRVGKGENTDERRFENQLFGQGAEMNAVGGKVLLQLAGIK